MLSWLGTIGFRKEYKNIYKEPGLLDYRYAPFMRDSEVKNTVNYEGSISLL